MFIAVGLKLIFLGANGLLLSESDLLLHKFELLALVGINFGLKEKSNLEVIELNRSRRMKWPLRESLEASFTASVFRDRLTSLLLDSEFVLPSSNSVNCSSIVF